MKALLLLGFALSVVATGLLAFLMIVFLIEDLAKGRWVNLPLDLLFLVVAAVACRWFIRLYRSTRLTTS